MHLRDFVKQQWAAAGLYQKKDAQLQAFLKHIDDTPMECWNDYVALFRREYYKLFDVLVPPLLRTDDKLLRVALIREADPTQPKELTALREFIRTAHPVADKPELNAILNVARPVVAKDFANRPELREFVAPPPTLERKVGNTAPHAPPAQKTKKRNAAR